MRKSMLERECVRERALVKEEGDTLFVLVCLFNCG